VRRLDLQASVADSVARKVIGLLALLQWQAQGMCRAEREQNGRAAVMHVVEDVMLHVHA
jgi:hypothetical protein